MITRFAATAVLILIGFSAFAHSGATGIVKLRMDAMKDVAANMKLVGEMISGKTAFDGASVERASLAISDHAKAIPEQFPEGSNQHPSEALETIWTNREGFLASAMKMEETATALKAVAQTAGSVSDIKPAFGELAKTCSACHGAFRVKK